MIIKLLSGKYWFRVKILSGTQDLLQSFILS